MKSIIDKLDLKPVSVSEYEKQRNEMLEELIYIQLHSESIYNTEFSETYYKEIIERITGKTWPEIKDLLESE